MASAAAVAVDIERSPLHNHEQNDEIGTTGTITSRDNAAAALAELDSDIAIAIARPKQNGQLQSQANEEGDEQIAADEVVDQGLFGSGSEDEGADKPRQLDDEELDSGDDEGRNERALDDGEGAVEDQLQEELTFMDVELGRHAIPEPSDGELYLLKVPRFLGIDPYAFQPQTFQPPLTDHHSKTAPSTTFSAYTTALTTIRWRRSPSAPSQLQSNALSRPRQRPRPTTTKPPKPTPTSLKKDKRKGPKSNGLKPYNADIDSFTYLAAPNERAQVLRITNKITAGLVVQPSKDASDDALERLQNSLAAAVRGNGIVGTAGSGGISTIQVTENPELAHKKAELAEKEKARAQKRREAQEARERERTGKVFGKRGMGVGLTVGGLEDDDDRGRGVGGGRSSGMGGRRAKPKRQRRGEIYSDEDEEYGRRGKTKEDEYDEEDDFVARSDEEEEVVEDDGDEDEGIEEDRPVSKRRETERSGTPKRPREAEGEAAAADGNEDGDGLAADGSPQARGKRRRVIEEDEDE